MIPAPKKQTDNHVVSLRVLLDDYLKARKLKDSTAKDYRARIARWLGDWLDLPITQISSDMVMQRHAELSNLNAKTGTGERTANLTMRILRALFNFAKEAYRIDNKPILSENPVHRLTALGVWNPERRRRTIINRTELKAWFDSVLNLRNSTIRDYLIFILLTGARRSEAAGLQWNDVNFQAGLVTFRDTKNHDDHILPLSDYLLELLSERRRQSDLDNHYVFPGNKSGKPLNPWLDTYRKVTELSGVKFTLHDLRRTFLTTAEGLDIPHFALKRLANHRSSSDVTAGYIIHDVERLRKPMQLITDQILLLAEQKHRSVNSRKLANLNLSLEDVQYLLATMQDFKNLPGYLKLFARFPLRPIRTEEQYQHAKEVLRSISHQDELTQDEKDYVEVLSDLSAAYEEQQHNFLMALSPNKVLRHLMHKKRITQHDLTKLVSCKSTISEFLSGHHSLSERNALKIACHLKIDPDLLFRRQ